MADTDLFVSLFVNLSVSSRLSIINQIMDLKHTITLRPHFYEMMRRATTTTKEHWIQAIMRTSLIKC